MKRLFLALILIFSVLPTANAAISAKSMVQLAQVDNAATGLVAFGSQIAVYGNRETNGFAQLVNGPTIELTSGVES
ncbi:MAG: hypothetical protein RL534_784, partial [Actinomycetota bacterium]